MLCVGFSTALFLIVEVAPGNASARARRHARRHKGGPAGSRFESTSYNSSSTKCSGEEQDRYVVHMHGVGGKSRTNAGLALKLRPVQI